VSLREGMCLRLTYLRTRCSLFSCIVCCVRIPLECHCRRTRTSACAERTALFNYDVESPTREIPMFIPTLSEGERKARILPHYHPMHASVLIYAIVSSFFSFISKSRRNFVYQPSSSRLEACLTFKIPVTSRLDAHNLPAIA